MPRRPHGERRREILETLARLLEQRTGEPVTTAELARAVGVSEAALYRHFPSKAKMFEGLLEFIEESLFTRINRILAQESAADVRVQQMLALILGFIVKNPAMASLLHGGVLTGETARLRERVSHILDRLETQLRQILREAAAAQGLKLPVNETASLLLAFTEGRIARYVRQGLSGSPLDDFPSQWALLETAIFRQSPLGLMQAD